MGCFGQLRVEILEKKKKKASLCVSENVLLVAKINGLSWFFVMASLLLYCPVVSFCLTKKIDRLLTFL